MVVLFILFCFYASVSGMKDAILYGRSAAETFTWNEHLLFGVERLVVTMMAVITALFVRLSAVEVVILITVLDLHFHSFITGFITKLPGRSTDPTTDSGQTQERQRQSLNFRGLFAYQCFLLQSVY